MNANEKTCHFAMRLRGLGALLLVGLICGCSHMRLPNLGSEKPESKGDQANQIGWTENYAQAVQAAERSGRLILADFTGSDWCHWCQRLEREVFATERFHAWSDERFVFLKVDFPHNRTLPEGLAKQNAQLNEQYSKYVQGFPTVLVLSPDGRVLAKSGYVSGGPDRWIEAIEQQLGR